MSERCNILPDPRFAEWRGELAERLGLVARQIEPGNFSSLLDPLMRNVVHEGFRSATAHEGTVWLLDQAGQFLVPAFNTGPNFRRLVGQIRQPVDSGLIGMVLASEQPLVENEVYRNAHQNKTVDHLLEIQTCAQIAVPFHFLRRCRGVISCVQLKPAASPEPDPPGFNPVHLTSIERTAALLSRLLEYRLLSATLGWINE